MSIFTDALAKYYTDVTADDEGRYRSWEHCYYQFTLARNSHLTDEQIDTLSLHLAFYLASWGMYRGSSFLLQKSYRVHTPAIKMILSPKYDILCNVSCAQLQEEALSQLFELSEELKAYYDGIRKTVVDKEIKHDISTTLITKILMGTLGCVPAYDRYFCQGVRMTGAASGLYTRSSIRSLSDFYRTYEAEFESHRKTMKVGDILYPQMKLVDMIFWQIGFDDDEKKGV